MRYVSLFSGIEAASCAWEPLGWKALAFAEIEPFPSAVLAFRWPAVPNLGDVTKADWAPFAGKADVLVGGPPCFTAGQMVLAERGYTPIEQIRVGDRVITHLGRLRTVVRIGSKPASVGNLRMVGMPDGVICTPEHPFLSRRWANQNTRRGGEYARIASVGDAEWTPAEQMPGRQWVALTSYGEESTHASPTPRLSAEQAMRLAGMYLGDGWVRRHGEGKKMEVVLGMNAAKVAAFRAAFPGVAHSVSVERTTHKLFVCDTALARWLVEHFGEKCHGKHIPSWVLSDVNRADLLAGYLATDGHVTSGGSWAANSVSRALAFGVRDLAQTCGYVASISITETAPTTVIEGRTVNQRDYWSVRAGRTAASRKSRTVGIHLLRAAQDFTLIGEPRAVFNIEVEEDHSYVLDGAVVHNCQAFSVAGLRRSLDDDRGNLTLRYVRICDAIEPRFIVYENVPGILSTKDNAFGCLLAALVGADAPVVPSRRLGWTDAGVVAGPRRVAAWRTLDAQFFGLPQRRRRVFVVACPRDGADPAQILLESACVRRDPPPRRETRKDVAPTLSSRPSGGGGLGTDFDLDGGLIPQVSRCLNAKAGGGRIDGESDTFIPIGGSFDVAHSLRAEGFAAGEDGTGRGTPLTPVAVDLQNVALTGDQTGTLDTSRPGRGGGQAVLSVALRGREGGATAELGDDKAHALRASHGGGDKPHVLAFDTTQMTSKANRSNPRPGDPSHPLARGAHAPAAAFGWQNSASQGDSASEVCTPTPDKSKTPAALNAGGVRRLTPRECERLMGMPDDYTLVPYRGRQAADGNRYKALGNSMAIPCMAWIGRRIQAVALLLGDGGGA